MAYFYGNFFLRNPGLRGMFPLAMDGQRQRLFDALARCAWGADQQAELTEYLRDLARDHRKFGVTGNHCRAFCDALLASLQSSSPGWRDETLAAWQALLDHIATVMADAVSAAAGEPAWWVGEVVRHERRGPGLAVVTIRPDGKEPLRYRPGQYISIQLPQWPRVWRCYSVANAPRPDRTLDLHVRAVPGGRISSFLVAQARPGDGLVIGPARGSMTLAAATRCGSILGVAGGTGLAPLKALAEELAAASGAAPAVRLLVAARQADELYDLPDLEQLAAACPSLSVVPVVAPATKPGRSALLAAAAEQLTPDTGDVFISGPDAMVRATIRRLAALAPGARIHADASGPWRPDRRQRHRGNAGCGGGHDDSGEGEPPVAGPPQPPSHDHAPAGERVPAGCGGLRLASG